ncbi:MAG: 50S ribosomal protein L11 methyltransferase, partial [Acidobacteriota bacterium]
SPGGWLSSLALRAPGLPFWWRRRRSRTVSRLSLVEVGGIPLIVLPGVSDPSRCRATLLLREVLASGVIPPGASVLDMPCASGVLTVEAARWARRVAAVDIDPRAVRCTRINVLLNGCDERVVVREGDLFDPVVGNRFDVVVCRPTRGSGEAARDEHDGPSSQSFAERLAARLGEMLTSAGTAWVAIASNQQRSVLLGALRARGFDCQVFRRRAGAIEWAEVYRCTRAARP